MIRGPLYVGDYILLNVQNCKLNFNLIPLSYTNIYPSEANIHYYSYKPRKYKYTIRLIHCVNVFAMINTDRLFVRKTESEKSKF